MSQGSKSQLYNELKAAGVEFGKHYRDYTVEDLEMIRDQLYAEYDDNPNEQYRVPAESMDPDEVEAAMQEEELPRVAAQPETTLPAQGAYQDGYEEKPLRIEPSGRIVYRDEVRKPNIAAPRARRVLRYVDSGTETKTIDDGRGFIETFEIAGNQRREAEVKITMPSYQVGVYKEPQFPFKIHEYNSVRGFDFFDVNDFYGGADMVPTDILRIYVASDLCYDIRTTIRAIETEARQLQLQKGML